MSGRNDDAISRGREEAIKYGDQVEHGQRNDSFDHAGVVLMGIIDQFALE
jgi:hypothetical protein